MEMRQVIPTTTAEAIGEIRMYFTQWLGGERAKITQGRHGGFWWYWNHQQGPQSSIEG